MRFLLQLVPLAVLIALLAIFVKLAALVVRRTKLTWLHALTYAVLVVVLVLAAIAGGRLFARHELDPLIAQLVGLALNIVMGAWFLRNRATSRTGQPVGWAGGALVSGVMVALIGSTGLALGAVMWVLWSPRP